MRGREGRHGRGLTEIKAITWQSCYRVSYDTMVGAGLICQPDA